MVDRTVGWDGGGAMVDCKCIRCKSSKLVVTIFACWLANNDWLVVGIPLPFSFDLFKASSSINSSLCKFSRLVATSDSRNLDYNLKKGVGVELKKES